MGANPLSRKMEECIDLPLCNLCVDATLQVGSQQRKAHRRCSYADVHPYLGSAAHAWRLSRPSSAWCCFPALVFGLGTSSAGCLRCGRRRSTWWLGVTLGLRRSGLLALPAGSYNGWLTTAFLPSPCGRLIFV